jgi:hypothetical protein
MPDQLGHPAGLAMSGQPNPRRVASLSWQPTFRERHFCEVLVDGMPDGRNQPVTLRLGTSHE